MAAGLQLNNELAVIVDVGADRVYDPVNGTCNIFLQACTNVHSHNNVHVYMYACKGLLPICTMCRHAANYKDPLTGM